MAAGTSDRVISDGQVAGLDTRFDDRRTDDKKRAAQIAAQKKTDALNQERNGSGFAVKPTHVGPAVIVEKAQRGIEGVGNGPTVGDGKRALQALEGLLVEELPALPQGQKPLARFSTEQTAVAAMAGKPLSSEAMARFPLVSLLNTKLSDGEANLVMRSYARVARSVIAGLSKGPGTAVVPTSKALDPVATKALSEAFRPLVSYATAQLDAQQAATNTGRIAPEASEADSEGAGAKANGSEGTSKTPNKTSKSKVSKVPPIPPEIEQSIRDAAKGPLAVFAGDGPLDIDQLVELVMMECAVDAEKDLADMAAEMNKLSQAKAAQRKLAQSYRDAKTEMDSEMRNEFNVLKSQGKIAEGWTVEDYTKWRRVVVVPPARDADGTLAVDAKGEPKMPKPTVAQPSPPKLLPPFFTKPKNPDPASAANKKGRVPGDIGDDFGLMPEQVTMLQKWFTQFVWSDETRRNGLVNSGDAKAGFREWLEMSVGVVRANDGDIEGVIANNKAIGDWLATVGTPKEEDSINKANDAASKEDLAYLQKLLLKLKQQGAIMDAAKKVAVDKMMAKDLEAISGPAPGSDAAVGRIGRELFGNASKPDLEAWRSKLIAILQNPSDPVNKAYADRYEQRARNYMESDGLSDTGVGLGQGADMSDVKTAMTNFANAAKELNKIAPSLYLNKDDLAAFNQATKAPDMGRVQFWISETLKTGLVDLGNVIGAVMGGGMKLGDKAAHYTGNPDAPFDPNKLVPVSGDYKKLLTELKAMQAKYQGETAQIDNQYSAYGLSQEQIHLVQYMYQQLGAKFGSSPSAFASALGLVKDDGSDPQLQKKNFDAINAFIDKHKTDNEALYGNLQVMGEFAKNGMPDGKAFLLTPAAMSQVTKLWVQLGPTTRAEFKDFNDFLVKGLQLDNSDKADSAKNVEAIYAYLGAHPGLEQISKDLSLLQHPFDSADFQFPSKSTYGALFEKLWNRLSEADRTKYGHDINQWAKQVVGLQSRDPGGKNEQRVLDYCKQLDGNGGGGTAKALSDKNLNSVLSIELSAYAKGASTSTSPLDTGGAATGAIKGVYFDDKVAYEKAPALTSTYWEMQCTFAKEGSLGGGDDAYLKFLKSKGFITAPAANQLGVNASGIDPATGDNKTTGEHSQNAPAGMVGAELCTLDQLDNLGQAAKDDLDSLSEMSEMKMMKLQLLMDRRAKLLEAVSNVMKKVATSADGIIANLKA